MKIVKKSKLPRWLISRLPSGEEEHEISSMVVPIVLFSIMAIGMIWYEFHVSTRFVLEILLAVIALAVVCAIVWWILVQVDVLILLRNRYKSHYEKTRIEKEKSKIKKKLEDLCVNV